MVLSKRLGFAEALNLRSDLTRDRLISLLEKGVIDSWDRDTGWRIPPAYWSAAGPPPAKPDADDWIPASVSLRWPLNLADVELLRAEVEALDDPPSADDDSKSIVAIRHAKIDGALRAELRLGPSS